MKILKKICDEFVNNKLCIHFGDDKTKSIVFVIKRRVKNICKLNIRYKEINIKQQARVRYLECVLDESISGETIKGCKQNKQETKIPLSEKYIFNTRTT